MEEIANEYLKTKNSSWDFYTDAMHDFLDISLEKVEKFIQTIESYSGIEFFNPGGLYDGLTIEQLLSYNYKSKTRNKLIALMFKECGLIEKYGSGMGRIKRYCKEYGLVEPKFEEIQKGFQITVSYIWNNFCTIFTFFKVDQRIMSKRKLKEGVKV